jgi:anti-sigma B factor antagonist
MNGDPMEDKMDITVREQGNVNVLILKGKLDLANSGDLKSTVKSLLEQDKNLMHFNMQGVDFINSSGLGALVSMMKEVRVHKGRLTLSDLAPYVNEIFEITQLSNVFEIYGNETEAVNSYTAMPVV